MKKIIAALVSASALILAWGTASAAPYELFEYVQLSSGGTVSTLSWRAGAAQGCAGPTFQHPCINPNQPGGWSSSVDPGSAASPQNPGIKLNWSGRNGAAPGVGIAAAITAAGPPTWDWTGGVLTETGLFFPASFIASNPNNSTVLADRVTNLVIDTNTQTTTATSYECVEGTFLQSVGTQACPNANMGLNNTIESTGDWNVGGNAKCVQTTLNSFPATDGDPTTNGDDYGQDFGQGPTINDPNKPYVAGPPLPRGLDVETAGSAGAGCQQTAGAFILYNVVRDTGGVLILANQPAARLGKCLLFGLSPLDACPPDPLHISVSYMVLVAPGAPDGDGDGIPTAVDNCPTTVNANQYDLPDGDGIGDACDPDVDNDGVVNASDNCGNNVGANIGPPGSPYNGRAVANWNQSNIDGDLLGDACEHGGTDNLDGPITGSCPTPQCDNAPNGADTDDDNDGFLDTGDNCPLDANPSQANTDNEQPAQAYPASPERGVPLGDACDNCVLAQNTDARNVGIDQVNNFVGTNPTTAFPETAVYKYQFDADNDGYGNRCDGDFISPAPGNGTVNSQDYASFRTHLGGTAPADFPFDLNYNGTINSQDYAIFRALLGTTMNSSISGLH